ncbi:hypothetical protein B2J88_07935 [Rhodococcus sp. SRB_17]|nr:hypothetical protein [Rhodococcus sp. SRB_17]
MTLLQLRTRGRHRTGVNAFQLIARFKAATTPATATVNAPVCSTCNSINLNPHKDLVFGPFLICEDCLVQLDTDGSRL